MIMKFYYQFILILILLTSGYPAFSSNVNSVDLALDDEPAGQKLDHLMMPTFFDRPDVSAQKVLLPKDLKDFGAAISFLDFKFLTNLKLNEVEREQLTHLPEPNILIVLVIGLIGLVFSRRRLKQHN
jgi:hypothetical protein